MHFYSGPPMHLLSGVDNPTERIGRFAGADRTFCRECASRLGHFAGLELLGRFAGVAGRERFE
jgi:hypothetical protein